MDDDIKQKTWPDLVKLKSVTCPNKIAFFKKETDNNNWQSVTYKEFYDRAQMVARGLMALGLKPTQVVSVIGPNSYNWEVVDKGIMFAGGITAGIDIQNFKKIITEIKKQNDSNILLIDANLPLNQTDKIFLETNFQYIVDLNNFEILQPRKENLIEISHNCHLAYPQLLPNQVATFLFTSGSTGDVKCIPWTHHQIMCGISGFKETFGQYLENNKDQPSTITWAPLYMGTGRVLSASTFFLEISQYILSSPKELIEVSRQTHPLFLVVVPRMLEKVFTEIKKNLRQQNYFYRLIMQILLGLAQVSKQRAWPNISYILDHFIFKNVRANIFGKNIQFLFSGSAPISAEILTFLDTFGIPTYEVYGQTECAALISLNTPQHYRYGSVGWFSSQIDWKIADDGELFIKSSAISGTHQQDEVAGFDENGFFATGDLVEIRDNYLYIIGRKKEIIKTSTGLRISPVAVENVYRFLPGIEQIVVFGNNRKFLVALLYIDPDFVKQNHITNVLDYFYKQMQTVEASLPPAHRVKKIAILKNKLSIENDEITTSLKLRRFVIEKNYKEVIDELYKDNEAQSKD